MKVNTPNYLKSFINSIAYIGDSKILGVDGKIYYSKIDGSYFTRVGNEEDKEWLLKKGITEQLQSCGGKRPEGENPGTVSLGFNPKEQKWYGWSHRAVFGFGIGSKCKQGNCGFQPSNKDEFIKKQLLFWGDNEYAVDKSEAIDKGDGVLITHIYNDEVPNTSLRGTRYERFIEYPKEWGKGEWEAKTLEDAKQMAIDFAKSVS